MAVKSKVVEKVKKAVTPKRPALKLGDEGVIVKEVQKKLVKDGSKVKVTGKFNIGTRSAVCAFQRRHNLPVDGVVTAKTWTVLNKIK